MINHCDFCNRKFSSKRNYEEHKRKQTCMKGDYDCHLCHK
jgi:hypothetical protein